MRECVGPRLRLLGGHRLTSADGASLRLQTRKSWALLALVAQAPAQRCARERLAAMLWPRSAEDQARASLRQELAVLRRTLAAHDLYPVEADKSAVALIDGTLEIDCVAFEAAAAHDPAAAAALYSGEFAAGLTVASPPFEEWLWLERQRLHTLAMTAMEAVLEAASTPAEILRAGRQLLALDPGHEPAHRAIMRAHAAQGRTAEALAQFDRLAQALRHHLDAAPSDESVALVDALRRPAPAGAPPEAKSTLTVAVFGLAGLGQHAGAEDVRDGLAALEAGCRATLSPLGARVLGRLGDQIHAVFGLPAPGELDAERAVLGALSVLETAPAAACGIASGEALVSASAGGTAISGVPVSLAARLCHRAPPGALLVSGATRVLLRAPFATAEQGDAVRIFGTGPAANGAPSRAPLIGRAAELRRIAEAWAKVRDGIGAALVVEAEPGIGKTRLIDTALAEHDSAEALVFQGTPHHSRSALHPLAQEIGRLAQRAGGLDPWARGLGLSRAHRADLAALLDPTRPARDAPISAVLAGVTRLAARAPTILVFEDLHWMDPSTLDVARALAQPGEVPLLLLATSRPPAPAGLGARLALAPLGRAAARSLAERLRPADMSDGQVERIVARSDGIPLFLEELMSLSGDSADAIPDSLQETLAARLRELGPEREVLHVAAVLGRRVDRRLLDRVCEGADGGADGGTDGGTDTAAALTLLEDKRLLRPVGHGSGAALEFRHALVQETVYRLILRERRATLHRRIAGLLTASGARPELIGWHLDRAGATAEAVPCYEAAGRNAVVLRAPREAAGHFRHALTLAEQSGADADTLQRLLLLLGPQLLAEHGFASDEVSRVYRRADALAGADRERANQVLWGLWSNAVVRADLKTARALGQRFEVRAGGARAGAEAAAAHYTAAVALYYTGEMAAARDALAAAIRAAEGAGGDMTLRFGLDLRTAASAYACWIEALCAPDATLPALEAQVSPGAPRRSDAMSANFAHSFLAVAGNLLGDWAAAQRHAQTAVDLSDDQGFAQIRAQATIALGRARERQGDRAGLAMIEAGLADYEATGAALARPYALAWLAEARMAQGQSDRAEDAIDAALAFSARSGVTYFDPELMRVKAVLATQSGRLTEVQIADLVARAVAAATSSGAARLAQAAARGPAPADHASPR